MLIKAKELAKQMNYRYLRLFVVDINKPTISLYKKVDYNSKSFCVKPLFLWNK